MATYNTQGTTFQVSSNGTVWLTFCANSIDPVGKSRTLIDVTTLCSTAREYQLALTDGQEINVESFYDPQDAGQALLRDALDNGTTLFFRITLADTDSPHFEINWQGKVMNWSVSVAIDQAYTLRITIKPTGAITFGGF